MKKLKLPANSGVPRNVLNNKNNTISTLISEIANVESFDYVQISKNEEHIRDLLDAADNFISECYTLEGFYPNKNNNFNRLTYAVQKLSTKFHKYEMNKEFERSQEILLETKIMQEKMLKQSDNVSNRLVKSEEKLNKMEMESSNLVYNILGFIVSFSIISAAVTMFDKVNSLVDGLIFMVFTAWILLTTLIGLNNFYKCNGIGEKRLQNNYFLWKAISIVVILLFAYKGILAIQDNSDNILEGIGKGIYQAASADENFKKYVIKSISGEIGLQE